MNYGRNDPREDLRPDIGLDFASEIVEANTRRIDPTLNTTVSQYVWCHEDGTITLETSVDKIYRDRQPGDQIFALGQEMTIGLKVAPVRPSPHVTYRGVQGKTG